MYEVHKTDGIIDSKTMQVEEAIQVTEQIRNVVDKLGCDLTQLHFLTTQRLQRALNTDASQQFDEHKQLTPTEKQVSFTFFSFISFIMF